MDQSPDHVLAEIRPSGLHRWRAVCSCGFQTEPVDGPETGAVERARQSLLTGHGAREAGYVGGVLEGRSGDAGPGPSRPWAPGSGAPRRRPEGRLP
ncbi:hypothetical protein DQ237_10200 [Blastococcus sp. TF02-8]|uniref:hypothetical protein n=1 Tax=Blastococcus sp. TF02-8 TaxID=2250574 RepID=UPI000DEBB70A|nr:hypothetical protein [Blastococcus sp. TF02-8]RBY96226.1 hypothetical protein DQ237_10200 [Blastococcus sp. TF02-8]